MGIVTPIEVLEDLQEIGVVGLIKSPGLLLTLLKFFPDLDGKDDR